MGGAPVTGAIALLGDVMLGRLVGDSIADGSPEDVWDDEVRDLLGAADAVVCNLECCISERGRRTERIAGKPFFFRAPAAAVESLRAVGVTAVGLANNHALDYEDEALLDTIDALDRAGIAHAGAGAEVEAARRGVAFDARDRRIGVIAIADHPVEYAAGSDRPGIAHAELRAGLPEWLAVELARLGSECDTVIAFPHWGPNMTTEPSASQRHLAAEMQAAGAEIVAGHSAHVFHGVGWGERGPIAFDLGDAVDDYRVDPELRNDLGLIALWRPGDPDRELELVGIALEVARTRLAAGAEAEWIGARLERACDPLGTRVERVDEHRFRVAPR